jgi:hypothetical protein
MKYVIRVLLLASLIFILYGTFVASKQEFPFSGQFVIRETTLPHEGKEIRNFELRSSNGGAFLIMGDEDVPFIRALIFYKDTKVRLVLDEQNIQDLKRD